MLRKEVNKRSPLRTFERSIHGGLGRGNVGVVLSRAGVGKSPFLVGMALDNVMRDRKVLHSDTHHTAERVRDYYDEIFHNLAESTELDDRSSVQAMIENNRMIYSFPNADFDLDKMLEHLDNMGTHMSFVPDTIILDGYPDFDHTSEDEIKAIAAMAERLNVEVWLAGNSHRGDMADPTVIPESIAKHSNSLAVIVGLYPSEDHVCLRLLKDHDSAELAEVDLELDPTTLLLKE